MCYKLSVTEYSLTIFRMYSGIFRTFCRKVRDRGGFLPKICNAYPTMMKLGTVIPYLKKILKIYESRDVTPEVLLT